MNMDELWQKIPKRIIVIGLCSIGTVINYADRSNMAIAIIFISREFGLPFAKQGLVLSSFFVGYILTQVLGGALSDKFGGKLVLGIATACLTIFTLVTPSAAKCGFIYLILCRICLGISEGICIPSIHSLIASWVRIDERTTAVAIITASSAVGNVFSMPLSTFLESIYGWKSIFWAFGIAGIIWSLMWQVFGGSSPLEYFGIKEDEVNSILEDNMKYDVSNGIDYHIIQSEDNDDNIDDNIDDIIDVRSLIEEDCSPSSSAQKTLKSINSKPIPWIQIFSQREVWAILISQFCNSWGYFIMMNWLPTYYLEHFNVDEKKLGYYFVLPYAIQGINGIFVGMIADYLIFKVKIRVKTVRRTVQLIGSFGIAIFLLLAVYLASTPLQGIILISIGMVLYSFVFAGASVSQLDIAPRYAGVIFALGNTLSVIPAIFGVALTGWILDTFGNQWDIVWSLVAIMYMIGSSVFAVWVGGEVIID